MPKKYPQCAKTGRCWIKDCLYTKRAKSYTAPDGRRLEGRRQVQLFRFPLEPDRFAKWVEAVKPKLLDIPPGRLCKHHFADADFRIGGEGVRHLLEKSAVPSLHHDYPRCTPEPVKKKVEPINVTKNEPRIQSRRKSPTPTMKKVLGLPVEEFDEYDSDPDVDDIVEEELGFKLKRQEEDGKMFSDDDEQPMIEGEEFDDETSDEEVQMELIKLMAKKERGASPPPSPHSDNDLPPPVPHSPSDSRSPEPPAPQDDTTKLFRSLELIYRSLQPEVQQLTKANLFGVMKMGKKMNDDLIKNNRLILKPHVFKCAGNVRAASPPVTGPKGSAESTVSN